METGQPFEDVKKHLKAESINRGYPMLLVYDENKDPIRPLYDLWGNVQGISEADCTAEDCVKLIEQAHQLADEYNIRLIEE
jgi:hypothetical protein